MVIAKGKKPLHILLVALIIALLNGIVYVFLMPPWQHYDEPNHFEYAWWLANYKELPEAGDYDQAMRRDVAISMIENQFFRGLGWQPDPAVDAGPVWIGAYSQFDEPFLYYAFAALPLFILSDQDIDIQLYSARIVSLLCLLITVACGYGVAVELTSPGNPLRWLVPVSMALLPGYVELMTAVNNDVGSITASSLALYISVLLIRRGLSPMRLIFTGIILFLCIFTKETAYPPGLMMLFAAILGAFQKGELRIMAWVACGLIVAILGMVSFSWGDAAHWYRNTTQSQSTRIIQRDTAPLGKAVFQLDGGELEGNQWTNRLEQTLTYEEILLLQGKPVTIGAWMWSNQEGESIRLALTSILPNGSYVQEPHSFTVNEEPNFKAFQAVLPEESTQSWVTITAEGYGTFYLDGITLVSGNFPIDQVPEALDESNNSGEWGGNAYENLLLGSSAEKGWPRVRAWVDRYTSKILPDQGRPSIVVFSLLNKEAGGWYYAATLKNMHQTFWGKFGWGHVPLIVDEAYWILAAVAIVGIFGLFLGLDGNNRKIPWDSLVFLGVTMLVVWFLAVARGSFYLFSHRFIPSARYAYPAIIPTLGVFCLGWYSLSKWTKKNIWVHIFKRVPIGVGTAGYWIFIGCLNLLAILSIYLYYYA